MKNEYRQVVKLAPPGELRAYVVYEHQLDSLAQGSPVSLLLNFALFFSGIAASALGTLWGAPPEKDRVYYSFLIIFLISLVAGMVLFSVWYTLHRSVSSLVAEIKAQMPPNPAIEQVSGEGPGSGAARLHSSDEGEVPIPK